MPLLSGQSPFRSGRGAAKRWNAGARRQRAARTGHVEVQSDRQGRELLAFLKIITNSLVVKFHLLVVLICFPNDY